MRKRQLIVCSWLVGAVVFPSLLIKGLADGLDLVIGWFNLDYWLAVTLGAVRLRKIAVSVLLVAFSADVWRLFIQIYPATTLEDLIYLFSMLPLAALSTQLAVVGVVVMAIMIVYGGDYISSRIHPLAALALVYVGLLGMWICGGAANNVGHRYWLAERHIVESGSIKLINAYRSNPLLSNLRESDIKSLDVFVEPSFTQEMIYKNVLPEKILLVVAESWGVAKNESLQRKILEPLYSLHQQGKVLDWNYKEMSVEGGTLQGEIRELCNIKLETINLKNVTKGFEVCWPWQLTAYGYHAMSVHAAPSSMYHRRTLYPRLGFEHSIFLENGQFVTRCFSFPGACDGEVLHKYIVPALRKEKVFAYWLTLNSHFAYDARDLKRQYFHCAEFGLRDGEMSCRMFQLHAQFFAELAAQISAGNLKGVSVVIVGDHMPPLQQDDVKKNMVGALFFEVSE